ncbi:MAG: SMP-30/gluconolactonase/LRE family protein [Mongoliibacter sp.]|uniref:SMP-30/gluconolactonase/LRE family protein n=1 Tax=Mongoliibacter sp. TaxID=2022438 RepID=UPI0012F1AF30|nr:SMP-30/gluconolactonase/LRE family protein [Mongoliibacter sp.]TVP49327.1 MAG: SMP-30/gluconolactonase/LRE family protein [Mongoliibacter sp.]
MFKKSLFLLTLLGTLVIDTSYAQKSTYSKVAAKNAEPVKIGDGYSFTEGPAVHRNGDVYFTDQPNNQIIRWSATRFEMSVFMEDAGRANGMYFDRESNLIVCADEKNQLWSINDKGDVKVLIENYKGNLLNGPNDLWISPYGGIYITDPLYKRDYWERDPEMQQDGEHLYFLSPDKMQFIRVDENLVKPNGVVGTPDGKKLYVADIGDNKTYVYEITEDGFLINRELFAEMGSDGMAIDNRGNVYLTGKGVTVFNSRGKQIAHIPIEENWTANVVFGGTDRKTLFITAMGSVYTLQMKTRGVW